MKMAPVAQPGRALAWYKGFLESQGSRVQSPPGALRYSTFMVRMNRLKNRVGLWGLSLLWNTAVLSFFLNEF